MTGEGTRAWSETAYNAPLLYARPGLADLTPISRAADGRPGLGATSRGVSQSNCAGQDGRPRRNTASKAPRSSPPERVYRLGPCPASGTQPCVPGPHWGCPARAVKSWWVTWRTAALRCRCSRKVAASRATLAHSVGSGAMPVSNNRSAMAISSLAACTCWLQAAQGRGSCRRWGPRRPRSRVRNSTRRHGPQPSPVAAPAARPGVVAARLRTPGPGRSAWRRAPPRAVRARSPVPCARRPCQLSPHGALPDSG